MKTFRKALGVLAIIPLALIVDSILHPEHYYLEDSMYLLASHVFGLPIIVLNYWAWFEPEIIEFYLFGKKLM